MNEFINGFITVIQVLLIFYVYGQTGYLEVHPTASFTAYTIRTLIALGLCWALNALKKEEEY